MPSKASASTTNTAAAARASAHPYAAAHSNARTSRRTASIEEKPDLSPITTVSPTEIAPAPASRSRKKAASVSQPPKSSRQQFSACHACRYRRSATSFSPFNTCLFCYLGSNATSRISAWMQILTWISAVPTVVNGVYDVKMTMPKARNSFEGVSALINWSSSALCRENNAALLT